MGESDGAWGELASRDPTLADLWDKYDPIPEPGQNELLDLFVERKHITHGALVRLRARMSSATTLAYAGPGYIKYRDLISNRPWGHPGQSLAELLIVKAQTPEPARVVILAEGESDAARLTEAYPQADVAVMAGGALYFPETYVEPLRHYELVLAGHDNDTAGEDGAAKVLEALPNAHRFAPPANDWCEATAFPVLPSPEDFRPRSILVSAGDLLELEAPLIPSWYEHALLPIAGQLIIHGWAKSFKSYQALDLLAALAQGLPWACFEPTEEPARVGVMQYEIPWPYYRQRVIQLRTHAVHTDLFDRNFMTVTPMQRPRFKAGDTAAEDHILRELESAGVQVFLLDPVRRATGYADLNSEKEVRPLLNFFGRLQDSGITVVATHHDNKTYARQGGGDPLGMTGAGSFSGDADTIVSVSLPKGTSLDEPARNLHFTFRNAPSLAPRGMRMRDDGRIEYSAAAHGLGEEDRPAPSHQSSQEPPI